MITRARKEVNNANIEFILICFEFGKARAEKKSFAGNGCFAESSGNFVQGLRTFAEVKRKRPQDGGNGVSMLIDYQLKPIIYTSRILFQMFRNKILFFCKKSFRNIMNSRGTSGTDDRPTEKKLRSKVPGGSVAQSSEQRREALRRCSRVDIIFI